MNGAYTPPPLDCSGGMKCANFGPLWYNQQDKNHSKRDANMMTKVLFVCHGNICRSPMAEFVMKALVKERGIEDDFYIESAPTSSEELGNPVYPPARRKLLEHGIDPDGKTARRITKKDYEYHDYLIGMDYWNLKNMERAYAGDPEHKLHLLRDFTDTPGEIDDPWYTGDFDMAYAQIKKGCEGLLDHILKEGELR